LSAVRAQAHAAAVEREHALAVKHKHDVDLVVFTAAVAKAKEQQAAQQQQAQKTQTQTMSYSASSGGTGTCGGDLPPCYVMYRESRGDYGAYNPNGCYPYGCYGKWQFSGAWACKLGLPCDIASATPAQQDEAARQLWAGGSGCSNWGACG
jgi:hypothetical protein